MGSMTTSKSLFYCTRGWKNGRIGTLHPIRAYSEDDARAYMFKTYGGDWCTSYTKEDWLTWAARANVMGVRLETEQPEVEV